MRALLPAKPEAPSAETSVGGVEADAELLLSMEQESDAAPMPQTRRSSWAELLRRTMGIDVLTCPSCQGRMRLIALIKEKTAIDRILRHLGLPTEVPQTRPARAPPQLDFDLVS